MDMAVAVGDHDWRIMTLVAFTSFFVMTFFATWVQSVQAMKSTKHGKRPPILPYWNPFLGSLSSYLWDGSQLAAKLM